VARPDGPARSKRVDASLNESSKLGIELERSSERPGKSGLSGE